VTKSLSSNPNTAFVSVKVCTPGTSTCQTIDHILLDTGSYGLRIFRSALNGALPSPTSGLAECIAFLDGSGEWGPVQTADVYLGGEPVVTVPIHVIDPTFAAGQIPAACSPPNVSLDQNPSQAGYNGILGVGLFAQDCGSGCAPPNNGNNWYFSCSGAGCSSTAVPLASQVQNPVALLPQDNNGILVQLPSVPAGGASAVPGLLVLGIGTQTNNMPSGVTTYPANFIGEFTTIFNGTSFTNSIIDTGSNGLFFYDPALTVCSTFWFCPPTTTTLTATNRGAGGTPSGQVQFTIGNATNLFNSGNNVFAELGGPVPVQDGFDWGLPFFLGRNVFVGIEGKASSLGTGPYWAY
jgi:hypothetical protein